MGGCAVVKMHEAVTLRDRGITKPMLLRGPFDGADLDALSARTIMPKQMSVAYFGPGLWPEPDSPMRNRSITL